METVVRRVTPMTVLPDIKAAVENYRRLGFSLVETGDASCVGLQAGNSFLILTTAQGMAGDFGEATVAPLVGRTIPYIHVSSMATAKERLPAAAIVVKQVSARGGTIEALVEQDGQLMILAEKAA